MESFPRLPRSLNKSRPASAPARGPRREPDLSERSASTCACSLSTTDRSADARAYSCLARWEMLTLVADVDTAEMETEVMDSDDDMVLDAPAPLLLVPESAVVVL